MIGLDLMSAAPCDRAAAALAGFADVLGADAPKYGSGGEGDVGPPAKKAEEPKKESGGGGGGDFGISQIVQALSSARQGITQNITDKMKREEYARNTQAAITADRDATAALILAASSVSARSKTSNRDVAAAKEAVAAAERMGQMEGVDKQARVNAAQMSAASAKGSVARRAAERTLARARGDAPSGGGAQGAGTGAGGAANAAQPDFLTRSIIGPIKVWHAIVGALAAATAAGVVVMQKRAA